MARGARLEKVYQAKAMLDHEKPQAMTNPIHSTTSPTTTTNTAYDILAQHKSKRGEGGGELTVIGRRDEVEHPGSRNEISLPVFLRFRLQMQ